MNLLSNAHDAVLSLPSRWIRVEVSAADADVAFRIADAGPRLTPEVASGVFTPFFTTKPIGQGTGLGLSLSRSIVEEHGGTIAFDASAPNTTVVFTLPRVQAR